MSIRLEPHGLTARDLVETCAELEREMCHLVIHALTEDDLDYALTLRAELSEAAKTLKGARDALDTAIGKSLGPESRLIPGHGRVKRHGRMSRRNWKSDDLLRVVLDSRVADSNGEPIEESPLDKVRSVWGLKGYQASIKGLLDRGIEPDEFAETEWRGYTIEVR